MRLIAAAFASLVFAQPVAAQPMPGAPDDRKVEDVVTQPLSDANLKRAEVPPQLIAVRDNPYSLDNIRRCRDIMAAVEELNAVLGPDVDTPVDNSRDKKRRASAMTVAGGIISSLIPFRYLIREATGANKADNEYRAAIYAGVVRRGFLKGYGQSRGCKPPAAPMPVALEPPPMTEEEKNR